MGLIAKIQARLELRRLEDRYVARKKRNTFVSDAVYVDGEYYYPSLQVVPQYQHQQQQQQYQQQQTFVTSTPSLSPPSPSRTSSSTSTSTTTTSSSAASSATSPSSSRTASPAQRGNWSWRNSVCQATGRSKRVYF